jgi:NAD(P)-dependent dehydrogenase (short-subunit alcohol dehydrogenase family)
LVGLKILNEKIKMNEKRIAVVTGGASGLGLAITKKFTENNIFTIIIGRDEQKLKATSHSLGENCEYTVLDVTQLASIPQFVQKVKDQKGKIDILVNNAGINLKKEFTEVTDEEFQKILLTNLTSVFTMSREVAKVMIPRGKGNIINISSMAAHYGIPKVVAYTASKSGIEGMTRAMAVELSPHGINVNCIAPGFINTPMSFKALNNDTERKDRILKRTPMGKLGNPEDVANTAFFLASCDAAFITGANIPVDGGNSIGF